jgi:RNA polymerase sigma-70 factor (ECF subfamily)
VDQDDVLAARATRGDRHAFDELVTRHRLCVYKLTWALTNGDADVDDLVQEVFVRAFRAIAKFRGDSAFRTWLHQISVNVVRSHRRRLGRLRATAPLRQDNEGEFAIANIASSEDLETAIVRRRTITQALSTLSDNSRLMITLRDVEGLPYRDIAIIVGVPIGTVESRIFRARRHLRPLLESLLMDARA